MALAEWESTYSRTVYVLGSCGRGDGEHCRGRATQRTHAQRQHGNGEAMSWSISRCVRCGDAPLSEPRRHGVRPAAHQFLRARAPPSRLRRHVAPPPARRCLALARRARPRQALVLHPPRCPRSPRRCPAEGASPVFPSRPSNPHARCARGLCGRASRTPLSRPRC